MAQSPTQRQILGELVESGRLTDEESRRISSAPVWQFSVRELVGYLAGLIIAAGVVQIIAVVFQDASKDAVVAALYTVTVVAGLAQFGVLGLLMAGLAGSGRAATPERTRP